MKVYKHVLLKAIFVLGIVLPFLFSCQKEESSEVSTQNSRLEIVSDFIRLVDDSTGVAGQLLIQSNLPEVHLEWNTDSICNLDTTQVTLSMKNGRCSLPIKWKEKLVNGNYGPDGVAYKAGVRVTAGEYSKYVPLVWAEQLDSVKFRESLVATRAAGDVIPKVSQITMIPTTVTMNKENGASMLIGLENVAFAILDFSQFTSDMNIDLSNTPTSITQTSVIDFKWKAGGAPAFGFSAKLVAMSEGITQVGVVQYLQDTPGTQINITATPATLSLGASQGAKAVSVITTNDTQGWNASVTDGNWFSVTPSGVNGANLEVTALTANTTGIARTGTVTVTSKTNPSSKATITVTQAPMTNITLSANPTSLKLGASSGSSSSTIITTNDPLGWTAVSSADWLSVTSTGGSGGKLTVTATSASTPQRSATITVTSVSDPSKTITVTVSQGGVVNVKVMSIGNLALANGIKVGPVASLGYPYINGLTPLLTYNLGPNSVVPCAFTFYNYYCGGMSSNPNVNTDYANAAATLRQYDIDIACLFVNWETSPTPGQTNDILEWLNEKPNRYLIFAFDFANSHAALTSALGLYDRKKGGGSSFSVATSSYNDPTFQSIMINGPFGNLYGSTFKLIDSSYGNVSLQSCQSAGFIPILMDSQGRVAAGVNPSKRIVFHGDSQFCQNGVVNANGTLTPTAYGSYPQFIANIWAWMCSQVAAEK